jgi:hypothetical protein
MRPSSRLAVSAAAALTLVLCCLTPSLASGASSVTVRVEGESHTLVGPVAVSTPAAPVSEPATPEDTCPGDSGLGALAVATGGDWGGKWEKAFGQYAVESIDGESHPFKSGSYWEVWLNHVYSAKGLCTLVPESGSELLLFPCSESGTCSPLAISAPAVANVGEALTVHVVSYSKSGASTPVSGASITGAAAPATSGAGGGATVTFATPGTATLEVNAPNAVRDEVQVCVHRGNDGTCGTSLSGPGGPGTGGGSGTGPGTGNGGGSSRTGTGSSPGSQVLSSAPDALVVKLSSVRNGVTYSLAKAPRLLAGRILAHTAVTAVTLELRRTYRGRCYYYQAVRARFVGARCGKGRPFGVSSGASFSYLLPRRLGPGRYVLEVSALEGAGARATPALGSSRLIFHVR